MVLVRDGRAGDVLDYVDAMLSGIDVPTQLLAERLIDRSEAGQFSLTPVLKALG